MMQPPFLLITKGENICDADNTGLDNTWNYSVSGHPTL